MATRAAKIGDIIIELGAEVADLNREIDEVNNRIRLNAALPPHRGKIEAALVAHIDTRAARYKESLRFELRSPFVERDGLRKIHDGLDILRLHGFAGNLSNDFQHVGDAFAWMVKMLGKSAIDDLMQSAPTNGILGSDKVANDKALRSQKRGLEVQLEEAYSALQRAGMQIERRPDLSVEVFLDFKGPRDWDRGKFEAFREAHIGDRGISSRLHEKRADLTHQINRLEQTISNRERGEHEKAIEQQIAAMIEERKAMDEKLVMLKKMGDRRAKLFNNCLDFLRTNGVIIDNHL